MTNEMEGSQQCSSPHMAFCGRKQGFVEQDVSTQWDFLLIGLLSFCLPSHWAITEKFFMMSAYEIGVWYAILVFRL